MIPARGFLALATLGLLLLSGCSSPPADPVDSRVAAAEAAARALPAAATRDTGVVRGIVVQPGGDAVADAIVTVQPPQTMTATTAAGAFALGNLAPGRVQVIVQSGANTVEQYTEIVTGEAQPALLRFVLEADVVPPAIASFDRVVNADTKLAGVDVVTWAPQSAPVDKEGSRVAQCEATWTPSSPLTEQLDLSLLYGYDGFPAGRIIGPSPLVLRIETTTAGTTIDAVGIALRAVDPPGLPVSVSLPQETAVRCDVFYGFVPDADWTYGADGPYPVPDA